MSADQKYLHLETKETYWLLFIATDVTNRSEGPPEMNGKNLVVVYRDWLQTWSRKYDEFFDGRFQQVAEYQKDVPGYADLMTVEDFRKAVEGGGSSTMMDTGTP